MLAQASALELVEIKPSIRLDRKHDQSIDMETSSTRVCDRLDARDKHVLRFRAFRKSKRFKAARAREARGSSKLNNQIAAYQTVLCATAETNAAEAALTAEAGTYPRAALHSGTVSPVCKLKQKRIKQTVPKQTEQTAAGRFNSRCCSATFSSDVP